MTAEAVTVFVLLVPALMIVFAVVAPAASGISPIAVGSVAGAAL